MRAGGNEAIAAAQIRLDFYPYMNYFIRTAVYFPTLPSPELCCPERRAVFFFVAGCASSVRSYDANKERDGFLFQRHTDMEPCPRTAVIVGAQVFRMV